MLNLPIFRFERKKPGAQVEKERIQVEAKQASDEAIGSAQNCLANSDFLKYREQYEKLQDAMIEELVFIDQTETDPVKYGFACKDVVAKYRHIGSLLRAVKKDAGK